MSILDKAAAQAATAMLLHKLIEIGAVSKHDHVVCGTDGRHSEYAINMTALYPHTELVVRLCQKFAYDFKESGAEVVVTSSAQSFSLGTCIASRLFGMTEGDEIPAVYAEQNQGLSELVLRTSFQRFVLGKKVLLVADVLTQDCATEKLVKLVEQCGGTVVGLGAVCNYGDTSAWDFLKSCILLELETFTRHLCPRCQQHASSGALQLAVQS